MADDTDSTSNELKRPLLYVMSALYVSAGMTHFLVTEVLARIVPPQFPRPVALVYLSGVAEIGLGIGVLMRRTRRLSAWGLVGLLIAVFPANVYQAIDGVLLDEIPERFRGIARAALWVRLPLQGVLILWAWWYTRVNSETGR